MARSLPIKLYRADTVREVDRRATGQLGIPGYTLMGRAGEAALRALRRRWPKARRLLVLCGARNNAGDGYVLARLARAEGMLVTVTALIEPERLTGDAAVAWESYKSSGGLTETWRPAMLKSADVVVDAILGTGLARPLVGGLREIVDALNASNAQVFAIDIPTGLHADSGEALGAAVRADLTMTFVALKLGLYVGAAADYRGEVSFDDLGIPSSVADDLPVAALRLDRGATDRFRRARSRNAHKGDFGHVVIIGGDTGMAGAVRLAGEGALRAGAGRVTVLTRGAHAAPLAAARPELMCRGIERREDLGDVLERADVIAIGPGLGTGPWGRAMLAAALAARRPSVVDADALNLLAREPVRREDWVLTPHPGEAARLLGHSAQEIQRDRLGAHASLAAEYGGIVVLKGAGTIVGGQAGLASICPRGNPGMAAPGMGDVLTGIIAGLAAQDGDLGAAAAAGVCVHAGAGDEAARGGERGLMAADLLACVRHWVNPR